MLVIAQMRVRPVTFLLKFVSLSGEGRTWIAVALFLQILEISGTRLLNMQEVIVRSMLAALLAWGVGVPIKRAKGRKRPFQQIEDYPPLVRSPKNDSFPSSHASSSTAFFVALSIAHHPYASIVGLWAVLVSFSRYYLGVHFPSDIIGGIAFGICCGSLLMAI